MSELKATPGRWRIELDADLHISTEAREAAGKVAIADIQIGFNEPFETEQYANAMLIAAAPDLHEALQSLLDALDDNGSCQYEALRELGRDALAKSRGEQ